MRITAWRVHDTGLVAAPGPFRRLPGAVRHHQGRGAAWPAEVVLEALDDELVVAGVGRWPLTDVGARIVGHGPPITFVLHLSEGDQLLATAANDAARELIARLAD